MEEGVSLVLGYEAVVGRVVITFSIAGLQEEAAGPAPIAAVGLWWPLI